MNRSFAIPIQVETGSDDPSAHLAHHNHLLLFQKARQAWLGQFGYTERNIEGLRMFVVEANCVYKAELFNRDNVQVTCQPESVTGKLFTLSYTIERQGRVCARGFTKCMCVAPVTRKSVPLPEAFVIDMVG